MNKEGCELILERLVGTAIARTYDVEVLEISLIQYSKFNEDDVDIMVDCVIYDEHLEREIKYRAYGFIADDIIISTLNTINSNAE